jgi:hypothetical protein
MTEKFSRVGGPPGPIGFDPLEVLISVPDDQPIAYRESWVTATDGEQTESNEVIDLVLPGMFRVSRSADPDDLGIDLGVQPIRMYLTQGDAMNLVVLLHEILTKQLEGPKTSEVTCPDDLTELMGDLDEA